MTKCSPPSLSLIHIYAVGAVLGRRASREMVRHGTDKAVIAARFTEIPPLAGQKLMESGLEIEEDTLIVSREIFADGRSTARMMGRPVTASFLREVGDLLVNIHGQHETQVLLAPERHLSILDSYGDHEELLSLSLIHIFGGALLGILIALVVPM